jgi:four helix bundle protein
MRNFKNLTVWEKSMELVKQIYLITSSFPDSEKFGLISQMRRCSVSIPSNIAEGTSRNSDLEFKRFLEISIGSAFELETQLLLSKSLSFVNEKEFDECLNLILEVQKMLNGFISKLRKS